ncbi:NAD(P)-dependent dehydrogenase, short-chain alcohol dehydrogenase family [Sphingobium sp. AP50]|nr:NAD(P)-dependent dehydrogenase, short-chain alcohol dehydrogenase family [Sphingobium sp. AP50]
MTTPQFSLNSGFNAFTTAQDVLSGISLEGKVAIVTGGYSGLGAEMTKALQNAGADVIVPARSLDKAKAALAAIDKVEIFPVDLADSAAIDAFADRMHQSRRHVDILIHSAGIMASPLGRDTRGREMHFAVNHLAPFRLTAGLLPLLEAANGARIIALSSRAHRLAAIDFTDPQFQTRPYDPWKAYGQSKTANALFALEADRRLSSRGVRAFSVHPGSILTDLARHLTREQIAAFGAYDENGGVRIDPERDLKSIPQGAATALWCASSPMLAEKGGVYCENCDIAPLREGDDPRPEGVRTWAADPEAARQLWTMSEELEALSVG